MGINWTVRLKSPAFWLALIPAVLLFAQLVLALFGISFDAASWEAKLLPIVDIVFVILMLLGVAVDHTTAGISDSKQALEYEEPRKDE